MKLVLLDRVRIEEDKRHLFGEAVIDMAKRLDCNPNHLMMVMFFESGLNPKARNPYGTASGLIQFTALTANKLGISIHDLRRLDAIQQLRYVFLYLQPFKGKLTSLIELYLSIFFPKAVGKPMDYKFPLSKKWVNANKVFDANNDGTITKWEVKYKLHGWFRNKGIDTEAPTF